MTRQDRSKLIRGLFRANPEGRFTQREIEASLGIRGGLISTDLRVMIARRYLRRERIKEGYVYFKRQNSCARKGLSGKRTVLSAANVARATIDKYQSREFTARDVVDGSGVSRGVVDGVLKEQIQAGGLVVRQEKCAGAIGFRNIYQRADAAPEEDNLLAGLKLLVLNRGISDTAFRILMYLATTTTPVTNYEISDTFHLPLRQVRTSLAALTSEGVIEKKALAGGQVRYLLHIPEL